MEYLPYKPEIHSDDFWYKAYQWNNNLDVLKNWLLGASSIIGVLTLFPTSKRLHDVSLTAKFWLLFLIPGVNLVLGIYLLIKEGDKGSNKFSVDPLGRVSDSTEEQNKLKALEEVENDNIDKLSWAIATEKGGGNENKAKSIYLSVRAEKLSKASFMEEIEVLIEKEKCNEGPSRGDPIMKRNHKKQINTLTRIFKSAAGTGPSPASPPTPEKT